MQTTAHQTNKEAMRKSYRLLSPFSSGYKVDFCRFCSSLDWLVGQKEIRGSRALDLGCGIGLLLLALKNLGAAETIGVDEFIFPKEEKNFFTVDNFSGLEKIWRENGVEIMKSNAATRVPFDDSSFDIIICEAMVEHLPDSPKTLLAEVHRLLKKGGVFLLTTPNLASLLKRFRFLFGLSPNWDIKDFFEQGSNFKGHRREFTLKETKIMLELSGFAVVKAKTINAFFNFSRFFNVEKFPRQLSALLSLLFPGSREMIYILSAKK